MNTLSPKQFQDLFNTGKSHLFNCHFLMARECLEKCLDQATDKIMRLDIHNLLGQCCFALGDRNLRLDILKLESK